MKIMSKIKNKVNAKTDEFNKNHPEITPTDAIVLGVGGLVVGTVVAGICGFTVGRVCGKIGLAMSIAKTLI